MKGWKVLRDSAMMRPGELSAGVHEAHPASRARD
jgi:hypothetical protein